MTDTRLRWTLKRRNVDLLLILVSLILLLHVAMATDPSKHANTTANPNRNQPDLTSDMLGFEDNDMFDFHEWFRPDGIFNDFSASPGGISSTKAHTDARFTSRDLSTKKDEDVFSKTTKKPKAVLDEVKTYQHLCKREFRELSEYCLRQSCQGHCGLTSPSGDKDVQCYCDINCEKFGDCCHDYHRLCSGASMGGDGPDGQPTKNRTCLRDGYNVLSTCDGVSVRPNDDVIDGLDPVVTDRDDGTHYLNEGVFLCNNPGRDPEKLTRWATHIMSQEPLPLLEMQGMLNGLTKFAAQDLEDKVILYRSSMPRGPRFAFRPTEPSRIRRERVCNDEFDLRILCSRSYTCSEVTIKDMTLFCGAAQDLLDQMGTKGGASTVERPSLFLTRGNWLENKTNEKDTEKLRDISSTSTTSTPIVPNDAIDIADLLQNGKPQQPPSFDLPAPSKPDEDTMYCRITPSAADSDRTVYNVKQESAQVLTVSLQHLGAGKVAPWLKLYCKMRSSSPISIDRPDPNETRIDREFEIDTINMNNGPTESDMKKTTKETDMKDTTAETGTNEPTTEMNTNEPTPETDMKDATAETGTNEPTTEMNTNEPTTETDEKDTTAETGTNEPTTEKNKSERTAEIDINDITTERETKESTTEKRKLYMGNMWSCSISLCQKGAFSLESECLTPGLITALMTLPKDNTPTLQSMVLKVSEAIRTYEGMATQDLGNRVITNDQQMTKELIHHYAITEVKADDTGPVLEVARRVWTEVAPLLSRPDTPQKIQVCLVFQHADKNKKNTHRCNELSAKGVLPLHKTPQLEIDMQDPKPVVRLMEFDKGAALITTNCSADARNSSTTPNSCLSIRDQARSPTGSERSGTSGGHAQFIGSVMWSKLHYLPTIAMMLSAAAVESTFIPATILPWSIKRQWSPRE